MGKYPEDYQTGFKTDDGTQVVLRPIEPEDFNLEKEMFSYFSKETQRFRFFTYINEITPELIKRYTDVDHNIEVGIMAEVDEGGRKRMAGVVRLISENDHGSAEFAIVVADPWQGKGIGRKMIDHIIQIAKRREIKRLITYLLPDNYRMKGMLMRRGFIIEDKGDHVFAYIHI